MRREGDGSRGDRTAAAATGHPLQLAAAAVGAVFLLVGVLGFIPGVTADNWLHLALAVLMIGLELALGRTAATAVRRGRRDAHA